MKCLIITTINLLLASILVPCQQQYREANLVKRLNGFFGFDHNIFLFDYSSESDELNRYIIPVKYEKGCRLIAQTVYTFNHNRTESATFSGQNTFLIIVADSPQFEYNKQIKGQLKLIRRLDINMKIGVFFARNVTSMDIIEQLFRWCWSVGIVNIFMGFYSPNSIDPASSSSHNIYRYDPFVAFGLINVSGSESLQNYFPNKVPNYRQRPLRFAGVHGIYLVKFEREFWDTVVRVFNASIVRTNISEAYWLEAQYLEVSSEIGDVVTHETITKNFSKLYPHRMTTSVLVVPHAQPFSNILAYLQNATWKLLFAYSFIVIVAGSLLLTVSGYLQTKEYSFFRCISEVINLIMNDNGAIRYGQLHRADAFVIVPFTFTGLIVVNGIFSVFQSYLTLPIYERQINSIGDLFKSTVPILANEFHWSNRTIEILEVLSPQHGEWSDIIRATKIEQMSKEFIKFNFSVGYSVLNDYAQWALGAQKRIGLKAYYLITETNLERFSLSFLTSADFPYIEPINDIIHRLQCSGLIDKWLKDGDQLLIQSDLKIVRDFQLETSTGSDSGDIGMPTIVWFGWIVSIIVFICEMVWNKIELQMKNFQKKEFHRWAKVYAIDKVSVFVRFQKCFNFYSRKMKKWKR